ncbi:MAG: DUF2845 domain-containing protein [Gammaproteobacteria bacterium]|nr:DUF2845 domain-containing protein [Gammaproteobacteria bacterium]
MNNKLPMASLAIFSCFAGGVLADDGFRCGTHLVKAGDTKLDVMEKCGPPVFKETVSGANEALVEQWHYRLDTGSFPRILTFTGGRLVDIEAIAKP